jgi:transcriptional regulator with XRE-family HTH domain
MIELTPEMYQACVSRDITALFHAVVATGISQRRLAELVSMSQSEVSAIMNGRRVSAYDILLRVANGLGIERGLMGLAYTDESEQEHEPEVDEDVFRRQLLNLGSWALLNKAVLGEPGKVPTPARVKTPLPQRVGNSDVAQLTAVTERLRVLDLRYGGGGIYASANAHALRIERLLSLSTGDAVRAQLESAAVDAHSLAGWAAYDIADANKSLAHFGRALTYCEAASSEAARILYTVAKTELNFGDPNYALKLLQLAQFGLTDGPKPHQLSAFVLAEQARAYAILGHPDKARDLTRQAFGIHAATDQHKDLSYDRLSSITGAVQLALGQLETAATTLTGLLRRPSAGTSRTVAVDLTRLATIYLRIGEIDRGVATGRHALNAVAAVPGSVRLTQRLLPLTREAASRRDPGCQDLARAVQMHLNQ